jgi:hypothetical protein
MLADVQTKTAAVPSFSLGTTLIILHLVFGELLNIFGDYALNVNIHKYDEK